jgi:hypothetical protein
MSHMMSDSLYCSLCIADTAQLKIQTMIIGKKLLSLKPAVRTRRTYPRVGFKKSENLFKDSPCAVMKTSVDVLTNASKFLMDTFYYVINSISDKKFQQDMIPCGHRLFFLNVFSITIKLSCC